MFIENEEIVDTAKIIAHAEGPSGKNSEYLFFLVNWLRQNFSKNPDPYLENLYQLTHEHLRNK